MKYYNENDPKTAAWLRALIEAELIPKGFVDERSIVEVKPRDLYGFEQVHFFAGIGGWSLALRLADWPAGVPVWTGSCPCQPFSAAGKRKGEKDSRNLWPEMCRLIQECGPAICFGEQVASKDGRKWLDRVRTDLEGMGYGVGAADLCAAGTGAPHIRQRLYWVAYAEDSRPGQAGPEESKQDGREREPGPASLRLARRLANADGGQSGDGELQPGEEHGQQPKDSGSCAGLEHTAGKGRKQRRAEPDGRGVASGCGKGDSGLGNSACDNERRTSKPAMHGKGESAGRSGGIGFWSDFDITPCRDGKSRRVEPGTFPLAHGIPGRVAQLRGLGNAIVPQVAAEFIGSFLEILANDH